MLFHSNFVGESAICDGHWKFGYTVTVPLGCTVQSLHYSIKPICTRSALVMSKLYSSLSTSSSSSTTLNYVISDLHLGSDQLTQARRQQLDRFFQTLPMRCRLFLLGDVFELWEAPFNQPPPTLTGLTNRADCGWFICWMKALHKKKNIAIVYIGGNHDQSIGPHHVQTVFDGAVQWGGLEYIDIHGVHLTHGHLHDMYNAPHINPIWIPCKRRSRCPCHGWECSPALLPGMYSTHLPIGYFICRAAKTANYSDSTTNSLIQNIIMNLPWILAATQSENVAEKLLQFIFATIMEDYAQPRFLTHQFPPVVRGIFAGVANAAGSLSVTGSLIFSALTMNASNIILPIHLDRVWNSIQHDVINMSEEVQVTLGDVVFAYRGMFKDWKSRHPGVRTTDLPTAFRGAIGEMSDWIKHVVDKCPSGAHKTTVICGHTHTAVNKPVKDGIHYLNDGTWVEPNAASYVFFQTCRIPISDDRLKITFLGESIEGSAELYGF